MEAPHFSWQQRQQYAPNNNFSETTGCFPSVGNIGNSTVAGPASAQDDDGDLPDVPLEMLPKFTDQDAKRDLATLTINDIVKLQADLTGMQAGTSGMSGLNIGGSSLPGVNGLNPAQSNQLLQALDREIMKLPPSATDAYRQALAKCPDEVSAEWRKVFLEGEEGNPSLAARRMAKYWQFRLDTFGPDKCFLPMTLTAAMADELMPMADRRVYQLLPCTDGAGRAIVYLRLANRDYSSYSMDQEIMCLFYLVETVVATNRGRDRGFVLLIDGRDTSRKHLSRKFPKYVHVFDNTFPVRLRAFHICHPNNVMFYIIHPIVKRLMPKHVRLRAKMHNGTTSEVLQRLSEYNLTPDCIPTELGGNVSLDMNQFLMDRMMAEAAVFGIHLESAGQDADTSGATGLAEVVAPPSKRPRSADGMDMMRSSASPPEISSASSAQSQPSPIGDVIGSSVASVSVKSKTLPRKAKRMGQRNVVDPRMALAVKAKQSDPDMKLYDALVAGGFVFTNDPDEREMYDQDGTSLTQVSLTIHTYDAVIVIVRNAFSLQKISLTFNPSLNPLPLNMISARTTSVVGFE